MSDGGKGDDRRPGAPGAYERGFDAIDWGARERVASELTRQLHDAAVREFFGGEIRPVATAQREPMTSYAFADVVDGSQV